MHIVYGRLNRAHARPPPLSFVPTGLPAVAVYRAGKLLDSLLRLQDLAGVARPAADDIAAVLARARVLDGTDAAAQPQSLPAGSGGGEAR